MPHSLFSTDTDLTAENLLRLPAEFGCPVWVYDAQIIRRQIAALKQFDVVRFAQKACYNDSMAAGAMGVLNDNGIDVPGEISLIGFDDVLVSRYVRPRLTTVRYPIVTMATQAAELALALADNRPLPEITNVFSPTLVRRHSVSTPSLEASHHATSD